MNYAPPFRSFSTTTAATVRAAVRLLSQAACEEGFARLCLAVVGPKREARAVVAVVGCRFPRPDPPVWILHAIPTREVVGAEEPSSNCAEGIPALVGSIAAETYDADSLTRDVGQRRGVVVGAVCILGAGPKVTTTYRRPSVTSSVGGYLRVAQGAGTSP